MLLHSRRRVWGQREFQNDPHSRMTLIEIARMTLITGMTLILQDNDPNSGMTLILLQEWPSFSNDPHSDFKNDPHSRMTLILFSEHAQKTRIIFQKWPSFGTEWPSFLVSEMTIILFFGNIVFKNDPHSSNNDGHSCFFQKWPSFLVRMSLILISKMTIIPEWASLCSFFRIDNHCCSLEVARAGWLCRSWNDYCRAVPPLMIIIMIIIIIIIIAISETERS